MLLYFSTGFWLLDSDSSLLNFCKSLQATRQKNQDQKKDDEAHHLLVTHANVGGAQGFGGQLEFFQHEPEGVAGKMEAPRALLEASHAALPEEEKHAVDSLAAKGTLLGSAAVMVMDS